VGHNVKHRTEMPGKMAGLRLSMGRRGSQAQNVFGMEHCNRRRNRTWTHNRLKLRGRDEPCPGKIIH
jgi:hypothetical protein